MLERSNRYRFGSGLYAKLVGRRVSGALILGGRVNIHNMPEYKIVYIERRWIVTNADDGFGLTF